MSIAVAGRTGLAHYYLPSRKWKLFGNETQERDFIVTGGLLWYRGFLIAGSYSLLEDKDEIRIYPRDTRLDNNYVKNIKMNSQVLLLSSLKNRLLIFCANTRISIYDMVLEGEEGVSSNLFTFHEKNKIINTYFFLFFMKPVTSGTHKF